MPRWLVPIALLLAVAGASPSRAGDAEDCANAASLVQTNAAGVVAACRRVAEQGNVVAQNNLGALYESGLGVAQDYAVAVSWYRKAAAQGLAAAQFELGIAYAKGQGVPQDDVQAHVWFNLAAVRGDRDAARNRDVVARRMTPEQIQQAEALAAAWKPTTSP